MTLLKSLKSLLLIRFTLDSLKQRKEFKLAHFFQNEIKNLLYINDKEMVSIGLKWTVKSNTVEQNPGQFNRRSLHHLWFIRGFGVLFRFYSNPFIYDKMYQNLNLQSFFRANNVFAWKCCCNNSLNVLYLTGQESNSRLKESKLDEMQQLPCFVSISISQCVVTCGCEAQNSGEIKKGMWTSHI